MSRLEEYKMSNTRRGTAVIINNKDFDKSPPRLGTDIDAANMQALFEELGFDPVIRKDNLTAVAINRLMDDVANVKNLDEYDPQELKRHYDADCFAVVILSHGEDGAIISTDEVAVPISAITAHFKGERCRSLVDKPKIFFIQACRGEDFDEGVAKAGDLNNKPKLPKEADFLMAYSTVPGYFSWRNGNKGSWFIQAVHEVFQQYKYKLCDYDLLRLMTLVSNKVAVKFESRTEDPSRNKKKQMPCLMSMLTKEVYFRQQTNV